MENINKTKLDSLIKSYVNNEREMRRVKKENDNIKKEMSSLYNHKIGEIATFIEKRQKNVGSWLCPVWEQLPDKIHRCVLTSIEPIIHEWYKDDISFSWRIEFNEIKKDGKLSKYALNRSLIPEDHNEINWTGEIYSSYK